MTNIQLSSGTLKRQSINLVDIDPRASDKAVANWMKGETAAKHIKTVPLSHIATKVYHGPSECEFNS